MGKPTESDVSGVSNFTSIEEAINGQRSLEDMFAFVWNREEESKGLPTSLVTSIKSEDKARKLHQHGDLFYKANKLEMALSLYNMSLMVAPHAKMDGTILSHHDQTEDQLSFDCPSINPSRYGGTARGDCSALSEAFAKRASLLFDLELYEMCLRDSTRAIEYGCPEDIRAKLEDMSKKCRENIKTPHNEIDNSHSEIENSHSQIENSHTDESPLDGTPMVNGSRESKDSTSIESPKSEEYHSLKSLLKMSSKKLPELKDCNSTVPALSSALTVVHTSTSGRGLSAVRYIQPGEVLAVERAYCASMKPEELQTHCCSCLRLCLAPLPCPGCSEVIFCSESCRQSGLAEDHWIECKILPTLLELEVPPRYYPHKLLKNFTHDRLSAILKKLHVEDSTESPSLPERRGRCDKGVYSSSSYQAAYHLCTNKEKFTSDFLLRQCRYAYIFTKLLDLSGRYFVTETGEPMIPTQSDYVNTGAELLSNILKIHCNQFIISEEKAGKQIGSGLFLTASLMNHSCNQSTTRYMYGRYMILVARRPIHSGEEVTGTYTTDFSRRPLISRRSALSSYHIDCCCEACENEWPTYDQLPKYRCIECRRMDSDIMGVCQNCRLKGDGDNTFDDLHALEDRWENITQEMKKNFDDVKLVDQKLKSGLGITINDLRTVCASIEVAHKYLSMPCQSICSLENTLLSCYYAL